MDELGVERIHGRPIKLFQLAEWQWERPEGNHPFTLLVAASASGVDEAAIRQFAADAVDSGCRYVCAWGQGCERVHDLFDEVSIETDCFVMSTWHADEPLSEALYFALALAIPEEVSDVAASPVILGVEAEWVTEVQGLVADQDELVEE